MTRRLRSGAGAIGLFARHPTAANLVMALMIVAGLFALARLNTQFFPDFGFEVITVSVTWPGATAEDVDANIVQAIEPEIRFLDGIKNVNATSYEGLAQITLEFQPGSDMQKALSEVDAAVAQVTTLPDEAERPIVRRFVLYETISRLVLSGPYTEAALKQIAKRVRDDLLARGVDKIDLFGARDEEIIAEIDRETLRRLDLTLGDVAAAIRETSQDLPSGDLGGATERQIRSLGQKTTAGDLEDVEIRAFEDGRRLLLRDVASVRDGFDDDQAVGRRGGLPAIELHIQRSLTADALDSAEIVRTYLDEIVPTLSPELRVEPYWSQVDLIEQRIDLLVVNGLGGLVIIIFALFLFLNGRVAIWVAVGIPVSVMATLAVMLATGQSINMLSLFGLIMALGIVCDDAIVVGEHAEARYRSGLPPLEAVESGATRMLAPVASSSLTTIAAFLPLFMIGGIIGEIIHAIPFVVVAIITASLIECFLVLPGHLSHALRERPGQRGGDSRPGLVRRMRDGFDSGFHTFRSGQFARFVRFSVRWRYATLATAIAAFTVALGLVAGGRVGFTFFPSPEADRIFANVQMLAGTPRAETEAMIEELERALTVAADKLSEGKDDNGEPLIRMAFGKIGQTAGGQGAGSGLGTVDTQGGLTVEIAPSDMRSVRTAALIDAWRAEVRVAANVETLTIRAQMNGPPGRDIDLRLSGGDVRALKAASEEVRAMLSRYPGVSDVEDDLPFGKPETILEVTPRGRALGFTTSEVGRQVRDSFEGAIARKFPRGDEEVTIRVRLTDDRAGSEILDTLYLRAPNGAEVPLSEVVSMRDARGFARVKRDEGRRTVAITAELDPAVTNTGTVIAALTRDGVEEIAARYGLTTAFKGKAEEQAETFADMKQGALLGLALIFIILSWVFGSYARPLIVMAIIPLGFVGAVLGHLVMGFDLTIMSMVALIGLSGIVINDSIVLVTTIDERRRTETLMDAVINGTQDRLRAVILTSVTTIGGLLPLLFETSLQAQFLIPMALTIVSGLAVATAIVLILVPALIVIQHDLGDGFRSARRWIIARTDADSSWPPDDAEDRTEPSDATATSARIRPGQEAAE